MRTSTLLFLVSAVWLGYVYIGYPALIFVLSFVRRCTPVIRDDFHPTVSVLISARNEEKDIGWKVRETLQWGYPPDRLQVLVASDASEDNTDEILRAIRDPRFSFVRINERSGKNSALNRLARIATGDLIFFTDANSHIETDCLKQVVRYFVDPRVGCVTGAEENPSDPGGYALNHGIKAFHGYEHWVKSLESDLGSVLVCDGAIFCIRRSLYSDVEPDLANDLELPLQIGRQGYWIICEPRARSVETSTESSSEEFMRRRRISAQGFLGMWRLRRCLFGLRGLQFLSRKLLRWLTLAPMAMALIASLILWRHRLFAALLVLQGAFYFLAIFGWLCDRSGRSANRLISFPFYFMLSNIAAFWGVIEACMGRRFQVWDIASLSRGRSDATI
jgi:cellulose synthase/poly-beta-1,6-N-acetylglucosamine synthase-like glycosyltransferase